ncbi:MAG: ATP synthase F1 subunit delta [Candidatus Sumerlaeaceae bacterium]|nr:ATP synthase F1 subunit delta [Candidatus Sumerlaeaceae bacterium]
MIKVDPVIVERYARALFAVSKRQGITNDLLPDVDALTTMVGVGARLQVFFEAPQITTEAKLDLIAKAVKGRVHEIIHNLLVLLLKKGRIENAGAILRRFRVLVEEDQGIFEAGVATPKALGESDKLTLQKALEAFTKARLKINYSVDPALIGGVRFSYGDVLIDDTVRGKLGKLRGRLESVMHQ